jgi:hypothetical protein
MVPLFLVSEVLTILQPCTTVKVGHVLGRQRINNQHTSKRKRTYNTCWKSNVTADVLVEIYDYGSNRRKNSYRKEDLYKKWVRFVRLLQKIPRELPE